MVYLKTLFTRPSRRLFATAATVLTLIASYSRPAFADSVVPADDGSTGSVVNVEGGRYTITGGQYSSDGDNLFHGLEQFNLNVDEIADFISTVGTDNIITFINGGNASYLNGLIQVAGGDSNLYLINPSGVLFGENASLNLPANFIVTTADSIGFGDQWLDVLASDSSSNNYDAFVGQPSAFVFTPTAPGAILNEADLLLNPGTQLMLIGGTVINTGGLTSRDGTVTIAAIEGEQLVSVSQTDRLMSLELAATDNLSALASDEAAPFNPLSLPSLLTGRASTHASRSSVAADGTIQFDNTERSVTAETGISLVLGEIDTVGETGGSITVLGDRVGLYGANLDASGQSGGGVVRIGGDYQGQGSIFNATRTFVDGTSAIAADALVTGDGGQVTLWADGATKFDGSISATGGVQAGNGGRVETSGLTFLDVQGQVDTSSARGQVGLWLLDPTNLEVVAAGGTAADLSDVDNFLDADLGPGLTTTIDANLLNGALSNITLQALNDITFSSDVNIVAPDVGLTANAGNNINVNANIRTNGGDVLLQSDVGSITADNINTSSDRTVANRDAGNIFLTANGDVSADSLFAQSVDGDGGDISIQSDLGDISVAAITTSALGEVRNGVPTDTGNAGSVSLNASAGDITLTDSFGIQSRAGAGDLVTVGNGGPVNITAAGAVSIGGEIDTRSQAVVSSTGAQSGQGGEISIESGQNLTIDGRLISLSLSSDGTTADEAGNITLQSGGDIDFSSGSVLATPQAINAASPVRSGTVVVEAQGDINFIGEDNRTGIGANSIRAGAVTFAAGGSIDLNSAVEGAEISTAGQNVTFSANDTIRIQNTAIDTSSDSPFNTSGNVALRSDNGGIFIDDAITTQNAVGDSGAVVIQAETEIQADSIFTSSAIANAGNIFLDPIGDIEVARLDATAPNGIGGTVDITAGRFFRATDSFTTFNGTDASIATSGQLGSGAIIVRHGGGGFTPFVVGDASLNGTQAAITAGAGNILQPQQTLLGPFSQGNIQIATAPRQDPLANIEDEVAPPDDFESYVEDASNPQRSAAANPGVIVFQETDDIEAVENKVNDVDKGFKQEYDNYYGNKTNEPDLDESRPSDPGSNIPSFTQPSGSVMPSSPNSNSEDAVGNETPPDAPASSGESADVNIIAVSNQAIREIEAVSDDTKPAIVHAFFSSSDMAISPEDSPESSDRQRQRFPSIAQINTEAYCTGQEQATLTLIMVTSSEVFEQNFPALTCLNVIEVARVFRELISSEATSEQAYLTEAQRLYQWLVSPLLAQLGDDSEINNFIFVMDEGLRDLPLAALHDGEQYLIESGYSFGLIPSISMTDLSYRNLKDARILPMGISNFDKFNLDALPAVPFEIANMVDMWGNSREPLLEEAVTVENLQREREDEPYEIVHLATHAEIQRATAESSYIQFGDDQLLLPQVGKLGLGSRPIELLVLSACETALGSRNAELGFSGLAHQAGVRSILASLWSVSDTATAALTTAFYTELRLMDETTIKAEALRKAQVAMLRGDVTLSAETLTWSGGTRRIPDTVRESLIEKPIEDLSHPAYWAGLTIVGNPW